MQYFVIAYDRKDKQALERRLAARADHLSTIKDLTDAGHVYMAAALLDAQENMVGSVFICEFESDHELQEWLSTDPYVTAKVWGETEVMMCRVGPFFEKPRKSEYASGKELS